MEVCVCLDSSGAVPAQYAPPSRVAGVCGGGCLRDSKPGSKEHNRNQGLSISFRGPTPVTGPSPTHIAPIDGGRHPKWPVGNFRLKPQPFLPFTHERDCLRHQSANWYLFRTFYNFTLAIKGERGNLSCKSSKIMDAERVCWILCKNVVNVTWLAIWMVRQRAGLSNCQKPIREKEPQAALTGDSFSSVLISYRMKPKQSWHFKRLTPRRSL